MGDSEGISEASQPPPRKWKNIGARIITGLLIGFIAFVPFYLGGIFWPCLVAVFSLRAAWEWVRMSDEGAQFLSYAIPLLGALIVITLVYFSHYELATMSAFIIAFIAGFERMKREGSIWASLGFLYIIIPSILLVRLRGFEFGFDAPGFKNLFYVMLIVIAADSGAYLGGSFFGGPKMAPRLSPNKTWSGFVSGLLLGCIIGAVVAFFMGCSPWHAAIFAAPIVVFSVLGDFMESGFKRMANVKDTGGLLPGHGGVLDRVDSLMMAIVFVGVVFLFTPQIWPIS